MKRVSQTVWRTLRVLAIALAGAVAAAFVAGILYLDSKDDLSVWHTVHLDEEFVRTSPVATFDAYLALEDRVFAQLQSEVRDRLPDNARGTLNRFHQGSRSDPEAWGRNWNRSFEFAADDPPFGVLLLHGYSDSPYSLRSVARALQARGAHVLGLRIPGHGTAPSGLVHAEIEDMIAAVRIAARHLQDRIGDRPLVLVGYSNGAALALDHAIAAVRDPALPQAAALALISPEIAVTPAAAAAIWQARIGRVLGLEKLAWNSVLPEYDPFKYGSFAVNAGVQVRRITLANQAALDALAQDGLMAGMPPILAFQSIVDATVSAPALVDRLFGRLDAGGHRLVLFDVERGFAAEGLLLAVPDANTLLTGPARSYDVAVVTNRAADARDMVVRRRRSGETEVSVTPTGLSWPAGVFSLSHVALPFPPDDPIYGAMPPKSYEGVKLGEIAIRGETRVLKAPVADLARMHWNPFHRLLMDELDQFLDDALEDGP
jgi:alpha-beta hydrolase superfamily lysophospholipase